jgi:DNA-binding MarR family transcriptional regulator
MNPSSHNASPDGTTIQDVTDLLSFKIFRLSNQVGKLAEAAAQQEAGLSLPEHRCLSVIAKYRATTVTAICAASQIDKAWVSRTLTRLQDKGLVVAGLDPQDGRRTLYTITLKGNKLAAKLLQKSRERQAMFFSGFSLQDKQQLMQMLEKIETNARAIGEKESTRSP